MEEGKQEIQEIEEIEEVEIVFGDVEPELLNNTSKQYFGEDAAADEHKSVSSGGKEGLEVNVLEPSMERRLSGLQALIARIQRQMDQNEQENRRRAQTFAEQAGKIDRENKELAMEIAQQVEVRVSAVEALAGNHTEALHGHEGRIALLEEDSSRTHFILGDVDRRLIELERDIPPQEGDSGVTLREGTRPSARAFEEQTKRLAHVEASLQVHEMEIESGKKSVPKSLLQNKGYKKRFRRL